MILKWKIDQINFERWRNSCTFLPLLLNAASSSVQPVKRLSISVFLSLSLILWRSNRSRGDENCFDRWCTVLEIGAEAERGKQGPRQAVQLSNAEDNRVRDSVRMGGGSRRLCIRQRPFIRYSTRQTATQTLLEIIRVSNGGVLVPSESSKR